MPTLTPTPPVPTSRLAALLERNASFAEADGHVGVPMFPRQPIFVVTCLDPRTDPAAFLGLIPGDAAVVRNAGGRVTPTVVDDVAFIAFLAEQMVPGGPLFEVAVVHHTQCGTGRLADPAFRRGYAARSGTAEDTLTSLAVVDPRATVTHDVGLLLAAPHLSPRVTVSGHVLELTTGLVTTVLAPQAAGAHR